MNTKHSIGLSSQPGCTNKSWELEGGKQTERHEGEAEKETGDREAKRLQGEWMRLKQVKTKFPFIMFTFIIKWDCSKQRLVTLTSQSCYSESLVMLCKQIDDDNHSRHPCTLLLSASGGMLSTQALCFHFMQLHTSSPEANIITPLQLYDNAGYKLLVSDFFYSLPVQCL